MGMTADFRTLPMVVLCGLFFWLPAGCTDSEQTHYKEMASAEMKTRLDAEEPLVFLVFETAEECGYEDLAPVVIFPFPLRTPEERQKLRNVSAAADKGRQRLVIVCPRDREEAKGVYDFLTQEGLDPDRLFILVEGNENWPYL